MRIKIISDGLGRNTKVINSETGEAIENCCAAKLWIDEPNGIWRAELTFVNFEFEVEAECELETCVTR